VTATVRFRIEAVANNAAIAGALADLHATSFVCSPQEPWSASAFSTVLNTPGTICLLALTPEEEVIGFIIGRTIADDGEVLTLCVAPTARRHGVATALIGKLKETLAPCRRILLEVAITNRGARDLYEGLGFREVGRRPAYYRRGGNAIDALILASDEDR